MADMVLKFAGNGIKDKIQGRNNPFWEKKEILDRRHRPTGKFKLKRRKPDFSHFPEHDREVLENFRKWAWRMDNLFPALGGTRRCGLGTIFGFCIPVGGDFIDILISWMLIQQALKISGGKDGKMQKDVKNMRNKMYGNVWVEFCLGFVPVVGALADTAFRANARNAGLLEELLAKRLKELELEELDAASGTSDRLPRHDTDLNRKPNLITTSSKRQRTAADRYDGIKRKGTDALDRAIDGISKDSRKPTDPKHDKNRKQPEVSRRPTRTGQNPTFF